MMRVAVPLLLLCSLARAGTVRGTVTLPVEPKLAEGSSSGLWRVENGLLPITPRQPDLRSDVVVVLDGGQRARDDQPAPVTVELHGLRLDPRVAVVPVGGTVSFKNGDRVPHTLYLERGTSLMPPQPTPSGQVRTQKFLAAGEYHIRDEEYPHLAGDVVAVDTPYVAQLDEHGGFKLEVPEGRYTLRVFWRGAWVVSRPLDVGQHAEVTVHVPAKGRAE
jgi:hypothetical protein